MDILYAAYGGTIKTTDEGMLEGRGIVFGSPESPDRSSYKDYFDATTYVNPSDTISIPLGYEHGHGYDEFIGSAVMTKSTDGWDVIAQLDMDNPIVQREYEDIKAGKYGFSTGAVAHYVKRVKQPNGTHHLKQWSVGEISITKRPAEEKAIIREVKFIPPTEREEEMNIEKLFGDLVKALDEKREISLSEDTIDAIVEKISVKTVDSAKSDDNGSDNSELKTQLADLEEKLRVSEEAKSEAENSVSDLTNQLTEVKSELEVANDKIAQLSLLAGVETTLKELK